MDHSTGAEVRYRYWRGKEVKIMLIKIINGSNQSLIMRSSGVQNRDEIRDIAHFLSLQGYRRSWRQVRTKLKVLRMAFFSVLKTCGPDPPLAFRPPYFSYLKRIWEKAGRPKSEESTKNGKGRTGKTGKRTYNLDESSDSESSYCSSSDDESEDNSDRNFQPNIAFEESMMNDKKTKYQLPGKYRKGRTCKRKYTFEDTSNSDSINHSPSKEDAEANIKTIDKSTTAHKQYIGPDNKNLGDPTGKYRKARTCKRKYTFEYTSNSDSINHSPSKEDAEDNIHTNDKSSNAHEQYIGPENKILGYPAV